MSLNEDDSHTITLVGNANKGAITLAKTCEQVNELRDCRAPRDWSILALQNTRTGKSHYLVICKCPSGFRLGMKNECIYSYVVLDLFEHLAKEKRWRFLRTSLESLKIDILIYFSER